MTVDTAAIAELLEYATPDELVEIDSLLTVKDPLSRLLDPNFTDTLWEYDFSRIEPFIPGQLHEKQVEALQAKAKHRWLFWGNQVGKTTLGAVDSSLLCLGRHPFLQRWQPPITGWASALTWELWENILLPELLTWIPADRIVDAPEPYKHSTKRTIVIRADNGKLSSITGKAAEQGPAKYQSRRLHFAWLDEEHPEDIWDELQPRMLRHGGITIGTMTPLKGLTWMFHRVYEPWQEGKSDPELHYISHAGVSDNPSIKPEEIVALTKELQHNPAQLAARLKGHFARPQGLVLPYDPAKHQSDIPISTITDLASKGRAICGLDFGSWRFAFLMAVEDMDGNLHIVEEVFSQREDLETRARKLDKVLSRYATRPDVFIAGDCANPQDIVELNLAFQRIKSPYQVAGVIAENKAIKVGVDRAENLINRGALKFRRGLAKGQVWKLGYSSSREGKPVEGSRSLWEINNWQYPKTDNDKAQKDDPDNNTADGADCMSALRYLVMSWYSRTPDKKNIPEDYANRDAGLDENGHPKEWEGIWNKQPQRGVPAVPHFSVPAQWNKGGDE